MRADEKGVLEAEYRRYIQDYKKKAADRGDTSGVRKEAMGKFVDPYARKKIEQSGDLAKLTKGYKENIATWGNDLNKVVYQKAMAGQAFDRAKVTGDYQSLGQALGVLYPNDDGTPDEVEVTVGRNGRVLVKSEGKQQVFSSLSQLQSVIVGTEEAGNRGGARSGGARSGGSSKGWGKLDDGTLYNKDTGAFKAKNPEKKINDRDLSTYMDTPVIRSIDKLMKGASLDEKIKRYKQLGGKVSDNVRQKIHVRKKKDAQLLRSHYLDEALGAWREELEVGVVNYKPKGEEISYDLYIEPKNIKKWALEAANGGLDLQAHIDSRLKEMYIPIARKFRQEKEAMEAYDQRWKIEGGKGALDIKPPVSLLDTLDAGSGLGSHEMSRIPKPWWDVR